ncbi:hypothetical protein Desor_0330 [Desulfosporosinus orientis DSM 765]|uniref:Uncharacterized protein n=2 Tax=Desulfosporosinus orientis TaxID=1563 RepID=G7W528_DESOD|nr:hypothetical protein Desor_0330 [Desulfosporosinus orientis DSM 765]
MAIISRNTLNPQLLTFENEALYLHIGAQGCALFKKNSGKPTFRLQEPVLLAHGIMTDPQTVHLVILKSSGDLCYTLITGTGTPQTTLIAKLDVRSTRYRRLFLFPQGKVIHIFYASTHQSIPELWRIEHRFWNGSTWQSTHMGEVVHPKEPLYNVNLDSQGNLHLCSITFQGRYSLLFTNRFNGTFHLWGSPTESLKIPGEITNMAALMTTDNVQHLFWIVKTIAGQFELRSAQQVDAHELVSSWNPSIAPIKTFNSPCKGLGALELGGVLWLLVHSGEILLMQNDGKGWRIISSNSHLRQHLHWVHKGRNYYHQTYWLEDPMQRHTPAFHGELGLTVNVSTQTSNCQPNTMEYAPSPPPVPAFYPEQFSSHGDPLQTISPTINLRELNSLSPQKNTPLPDAIKVPEIPLTTETNSFSFDTIAEADMTAASEISAGPETNAASEIVADPEVIAASETTAESETAVVFEETNQLQSLIKTVAHLEHENYLINQAMQNMLSKFDQVMEIISENALQLKQDQEPEPTPFDELEPVKEAMSNLEKETQSLSQVLRVMMSKQEESDSSLEKLESQICQLQTEKNDLKTKGGFWNKWIT